MFFPFFVFFFLMFNASGAEGGDPEGGALAPRLVSKCQNFGQFYVMWAILHQNFGQFHIFLESLRQNFGQFNVHQDLFFWRSPKIGQKKPFQFQCRLFFLRSPKFGLKNRSLFGKNSNVIFRAKVWCSPPNPFDLLRPCLTHTVFC